MKDIQEAIEWYQAKLAVNDRFSLHGNQDEAAKLALTALQEQAEREKGCEYCGGDALDGLVLTKFCDMPKIALRGGNCHPDEDEKPVFCPKCGKRLR